MTFSLRHIALAAIAMVAVPPPADAHFLLINGSEPLRAPNSALELTLLFTHPFNAGPDMQLETPVSFQLKHRRGEGETRSIDLMSTLQPIEWKGDHGVVQAYRSNIPASLLRSVGDYTFIMTQKPYLEHTEDIYIQQISKLVVNIGGVPGNWDEPVDLPAEIVPLNKPYANWVGGVFRGTVLSEGKPVPHAEIEVEFLNHRPGDTGWTGEPGIRTDNPNLEALSLRSDAQGNFEIGFPRAGWWGIAALGIGPQTEHNGKPLSQDAVLWVHATAID